MASIITPPAAFLSVPAVVANASVTGTLVETELGTVTIPASAYQPLSFIQFFFGVRTAAPAIAAIVLRTRFASIAGTSLSSFNLAIAGRGARGWNWLYVATATAVRVYSASNLIGSAATTAIADQVIAAGAPIAITLSAQLGDVGDVVTLDYLQTSQSKVL